MCTPWRVYPTHTRSVEGGRGLLDLSHADKNCIMGLIGLPGPGLNFRYFSRVPGQTSREREREKHVRNDNKPAAPYLPRRIYSRFSPSLPSSFRPSIPPFVPRPRNPLIPRDTHVRRHRTLTGGEEHPSFGKFSKQKEGTTPALSLPPPLSSSTKIIICHLSRLVDPMILFFSRLPLASNFFFFLTKRERKCVGINLARIDTRKGVERRRSFFSLRNCGSRIADTIRKSNDESEFLFHSRKAASRHNACKLSVALEEGRDSSIIPLPISSIREKRDQRLDLSCARNRRENNSLSIRNWRNISITDDNGRMERRGYYYYYCCCCWWWLARASRVGVKVEIKRKGYTITRQRHGTDANAPRIYYCGN